MSAKKKAVTAGLEGAELSDDEIREAEEVIN